MARWSGEAVGGRICDKSDVACALAEMIAHLGPYVLDVLVHDQEHVLPMISSSGPIKDVNRS